MSTDTQDQRFNTLLSALRANRLCKKQRKTLNTIRATTTGQVEPGIAKNAAIDLIDCFSRVNQVTKLTEQRSEAIKCLKQGRSCSSLIDAYVAAQ